VAALLDFATRPAATLLEAGCFLTRAVVFATFLLLAMVSIGVRRGVRGCLAVSMSATEKKFDQA
jgi:hypothetical protein